MLFWGHRDVFRSLPVCYMPHGFSVLLHIHLSLFIFGFTCSERRTERSYSNHLTYKQSYLIYTITNKQTTKHHKNYIFRLNVVLCWSLQTELYVFDYFLIVLVVTVVMFSFCYLLHFIECACCDFIYWTCCFILFFLFFLCIFEKLFFCFFVFFPLTSGSYQRDLHIRWNIHWSLGLCYHSHAQFRSTYAYIHVL